MSKQPIFCDKVNKPGGPFTHAVRAGTSSPRLGRPSTTSRPSPRQRILGDRTTARTTLQADLPGFEIEIDAVLYAPRSEG